MELEVYYTYQEYDHGGTTRLTEHIRQYFQGNRAIPVAKTASVFGKHYTFTFSDEMLKYFLDQPERIRKPFEVALKYGFRGVSAGGSNGIYQLRKPDKGLQEELNRMKTRNSEAISWDLDLWFSAKKDLDQVKIVYHEPSGERIVGLMNGENRRIIFLGFANYRLKR